MSQRALLIGINRYSYLEVRHQLRGCVADVELMRDVLISKFGFEEGNMCVLTDEGATREAILEAFDQLVSDTEKDDVVVIHYSGHGSQMMDREGDEADGYDETIMPTDTGRGEHENRDITDDEIYYRLVQLAEKTKFTTLFFDCCHSGTITRTGAQSGQRLRHVPADTRPVDALPPSPLPESFIQLMRGETVKRGASNWLPTRDSYVLMAACRDEESALDDYKGNGLFTYFLSRALLEARPSQSYRDLFEPLRHQINAIFKYQHPQIEGVTDRVLFGRETVSLDAIPYVEVLSQKDNKLVLNGGDAHGMTVGSTYAVYPPGTRRFEPDLSLAVAIVESTEATTSVATIADGCEIQPGSRAVETDHVYADFDLGYRLDLPLSFEPAQELIAGLETVPLLFQKEDADLVIGVEEEHWRCLGRDHHPAIPPIPISQTTLFLENLNKYARYHNILYLKNRDPHNPLRDVISTRLYLGIGAEKTELKMPFILHNNDIIELVIRNEYAHPLYISLLDLGLTGRISIIPNQASQAIDPGYTISIQMRMTIPADFPADRAGDSEIFKLFVTVSPTDFRPLIQTPYTQPLPVSRNQPNPLPALLQSALGHTRSSTIIAHDTEPWTTIDIPFQMMRQTR